MITLGSVLRADAAKKFLFLREKISGRRKLIKEFTHSYPEFVFWVFPDGTLFDAKDAHKQNVPKGYDFILKDEPHYGGFLRGRIARFFDDQIIVIYCEAPALAYQIDKIQQFLEGMKQAPVPIDETTLIVSDNGDIYGTLADLEERSHL